MSTPPAINNPAPVKIPPVISKNATFVVESITAPMMVKSPPPIAVGAILEGFELRNVANESFAKRSVTLDFTS